MIRFVVTGRYGDRDPRVIDLVPRDADDVPTAALAILLGRKALSEDRDLLDFGLATGRPWLATVMATGHVVLGETVQLVAAGTIVVTGQGVADLAGKAWVLSQTGRGRKVLVVVGLVVLGIIAAGLLLRQLHEPSRRLIDESARAAATALLQGGRVVVGGYLKVQMNRRSGELTLETGAFASTERLSIVQRAARILASAPDPMRSNELARQIWGYERAPRTKTDAIRSQLAAMPAFVEVEPDTWQLGNRVDHRNS